MSQDLVTNLIADASGFMVGANAVEHRAHQLEHEMKTVAGEIAGAFVGGFGIEKTIESFKSGLESGFEAVKGQIEDIVALQHQSEKLGLAVNDMCALRLEARHTGDDFESVSKAIFKMQVNLSQAVSEPGGKKGLLLHDLGLDAASLQQGGVLNAVGEIGDRIAGLNNQMSRGNAVFEIFGKSGFEAMNTILRGSEGLEHIKGHMQMLSPEDIRGMELAHESMLNLEESVGGLSRAFAIELAPAIGDAAKALAEFVHEGDKLPKGRIGGVLASGGRIRERRRRKLVERRRGSASSWATRCPGCSYSASSQADAGYWVAATKQRRPRLRRSIFRG